MSAIYADAAPLYVAAGWAGVLPVGHRPKLKKAPPDGFTGHDGAWPSSETVAGWCTSRGDVNVGLRLPPTIIAIDVDDYGGKNGADTLDAGIARHGDLPPTWTSTSRDGRSGISLYGVPAGAVFPGKLCHPDHPLQSGVDLIQYHHRYAVVWPSIHPDTGREYRWIGPDGTEGGIPSPDELPMLPVEWREHLLGTDGCYRTTRIIEIDSGDPVADELAEAIADLAGGSRHDDTTRHVLALAYFRNRGAPGAEEALATLRAAFVETVTTPGTGLQLRSLREAEAEYDRMVNGRKTQTTGLDEPPWTTGDDAPEAEPEVEAEPEAAPPEATEEAPPAPPSLIVGIDVYRETVPTVIPWTAWPVGCAGMVGLISGPPKAGKSTFASQVQRCRETGDLLLGEWLVEPGPTLLLTEESGIAVAHKTGGLHELQVLDRRTAVRAGLTFPKVLDVVKRWGADHPDGLVFIDTLAIWAGIKDENDAGEATRAVAAVANVAQATNLSIVVIHHARKSGGDSGEAIRGSGAILATVDTSVELSRVAPKSDERYLDVLGRVVMEDRFLLQFDRATTSYSLGDLARASLAEIEKDLAGIPYDGAGKTRDDLRELWQRDPRKRVAQLVNKGRMRETYQKEGRYWTFRYWAIKPADPR